MSSKAQKILFTLAISSMSSTLWAASITGAGATFPYPLYAKWAETYHKETGHQMNYQSIGSSGGLKQIEAKTVDFGASDMPLKPEELKAKGLVQFPTVIGGVVPIINLPGVAAGQLKLSGPILADIFAGKITQWNDPAILKLNANLKIDVEKITVVRRSDGSGTTFVFTDYLSKVSPSFKTAIGVGPTVNWTAGVGGKGNEGVSNYVTRIKGAIGYVEYAYAKQNKISHASLQNKSGQFVQPDDSTFAAAAAGANWAKAPGFYLLLTEQAGASAWPISSATFILMHAKQANAAQGLEALKFFDWAYKSGDQTALGLDYVPMPNHVKTLIRQSWKQIENTSNQVIWK